MSSLRTAASDIGLKSIIRAFTIPVIDLISTANGKAIGAATFENDKNFKQNFIQTLHDEALEPFWATTISWILAKISSVVTPWVPEQLAIIPGKLIGEAFHWKITSHQSRNTQHLNGNGENTEDSISAMFFNTVVKTPSDLLLKVCGLSDDKHDAQGNIEREGDDNFTWYTISQLGAFGLASFILKNDKHENLPGVNLDKNDPWYVNILRGVGYTLVEQITFAISQTIRLYTDFKDEFTGGDDSKWFKGWAKAITNMIHERFIPGHILLGFSSALSTYALGDFIPKTTAAALGEFPMAIFNRMANCHQRRATKNKFQYEEYVKDGVLNKVPVAYERSVNGEKIGNYRFSESPFYKKTLGFFDNIFYGLRNKLINTVAYLFSIDRQELVDSFDVSEKILDQNCKRIEEAKKLGKIRILEKDPEAEGTRPEGATVRYKRPVLAGSAPA